MLLSLWRTRRVDSLCPPGLITCRMLAVFLTIFAAISVLEEKLSAHQNVMAQCVGPWSFAAVADESKLIKRNRSGAADKIVHLLAPILIAARQFCPRSHRMAAMTRLRSMAAFCFSLLCSTLSLRFQDGGAAQQVLHARSHARDGKWSATNCLSLYTPRLSWS